MKHAKRPEEPKRTNLALVTLPQRRAVTIHLDERTLSMLEFLAAEDGNETSELLEYLAEGAAADYIASAHEQARRVVAELDRQRS